MPTKNFYSPPADLSLYQEPYKRHRADINMASSINVYRITSDDIRIFLNQKAKQYVPAARVEILVEYCERKKSNPRRSYAALVVGLSSNMMERHGETDTLRRMIETESDHRLLDDIFTNLVKRYQYDRENLQKILESYKLLDEFQLSFGMNEEFIKQLIYWTTPRRQELDKTKEVWTLFGARPDAIIYDMLEELNIYEPIQMEESKLNKMSKEDREKLPTSAHTMILPRKGRMEIVQVTPITKGSVEFMIYLHSDDIQVNDNPDLRKLLDSMKK